jgi:DNA repair protein RadC
MLQIEVLDHIVIGDRRFASLTAGAVLNSR